MTVSHSKERRTSTNPFSPTASANIAIFRRSFRDNALYVYSGFLITAEEISNEPVEAAGAAVMDEGRGMNVPNQ
jgi:hypothetical protein